MLHNSGLHFQKYKYQVTPDCLVAYIAFLWDLDGDSTLGMIWYLYCWKINEILQFFSFLHLALILTHNKLLVFGDPKATQPLPCCKMPAFFSRAKC